MKRWGIWGFCLVLLAMAAGATAVQHIYKWVKDKEVSSSHFLKKAQYQRVLPVPEARAQQLIRQVMTDDLYLALAGYHTTKHLQAAETTADSVLPEDIVGDEYDRDLVDEDYRFVLEVKTKAYGRRTRVTAVVWPVYRIRDYEKEDELSDEPEGSTVHVKINAEPGQAVAMGPIVVAPLLGLPGDYGIIPLPDAGQRAAAITRSFMLDLDRRLQAESKSAAPRQQAPAAAAEPPAPEQNPAAEVAAPAQDAAGTGIEVDVQTGGASQKKSRP